MIVIAEPEVAIDNALYSLLFSASMPPILIIIGIYLQFAYDKGPPSICIIKNSPAFLRVMFI